MTNLGATNAFPPAGSVYVLKCTSRMPQPITIDIPHKLGKAGVRARLDEGIAGVGRTIPGVGQVTHNWEGDTMDFTLATLGQTMR